MERHSPPPALASDPLGRRISAPNDTRRHYVWLGLSLLAVALIAGSTDRVFHLLSADVPETAIPMGAGLMHMQHEAASDRPRSIVRPISCERLANAPGKSMITAIVEFPPNAYTARHTHPGAVQVYVLRGSVRSQLLGDLAITYSAGTTWFEPPGAVHLFAENASSTEPAEVLAVFVTDDDCKQLVLPG